MDGTVVDNRGKIYMKLWHFAQLWFLLLIFFYLKNKTNEWR